jgi:cyclase
MKVNSDLKPIVPTNSQRTRFGEIPAYPEGLYDLGCGTYAWMVPNGSWGESNTGLITGKGVSLLIDTQWDLRHTKTMLDAMGPYTNSSPIRYLVNTHADGDHCWGNGLVRDAEIISSEEARDEMRNIKPRSMLMLGRAGSFLEKLNVFGSGAAGYWLRGMGAPYDYRGIKPVLPTRSFTGNMTIEVGGREVRLIKTGRCHTRGDIMVFIPDNKTLFAGDILFIGCTPPMWAGPLGNWMQALDTILRMDVDIIIPGHGPITDKEGVKELKAYWEYCDFHVKKCFQGGKSASEAAREIALSEDFAKQPFSLWDSPERIMLNAHTIYRHLSGKTGHAGSLELISILWKQAVLANELPNAKPKALHSYKRGR